MKLATLTLLLLLADLLNASFPLQITVDRVFLFRALSEAPGAATEWHPEAQTLMS